MARMTTGLLLTAFALSTFAWGTQAQPAFTDSAGRSVPVPQPVKRVFAAGPPASILLYVLAPDRLLNWSRPLHGAERPFIAPAYRDLPALGRLTGRGNTANIEVVLRARPDLILDFGSTAPTYRSLADRVQAQTGMAYVLIDGELANTAESLRRLGRLLGVADRADALADYADRTFRELDEGLSRIPAEDRPRVYFARGPEGLETGVQGSINTEIIERVGAINVAEADGRRGLVAVSIEQVLTWNPDIIIAMDRRFFNSIRSEPLWQAVDAVKNGRVFLAPSLPFGWVDRPPSINRLIGIEWLSRLFYPEIFESDLAATTRAFYSLFYQVDLSDAQIETLLTDAGLAGP